MSESLALSRLSIRWSLPVLPGGRCEGSVPAFGLCALLCPCLSLPVPASVLTKWSVSCLVITLIVTLSSQMCLMKVVVVTGVGNGQLS